MCPFWISCFFLAAGHNKDVDAMLDVEVRRPRGEVGRDDRILGN